MIRSRGDMASPRSLVVLMASFSLLGFSRAGPLGPLPNVTSLEIGLKEGSCYLGDVVYLPGDEFSGATPCERCTCSSGGVRCAQQRCEPRPGCKALHRPDHCCPTYQCECEQEGRVYGNGEKLVDPADPCRVCYCQGGEVVCRRIACFVRDDCTPRLVPGRCCPEYDNCPLRGVTALPSMTSSVSSISNFEEIETSAVPAVPKEIVGPEITIKEITPVSEIPAITDVKIKEILPSPSIDVAEYASSKSPLIPREATSEKSIKNEPESARIESGIPSVIEVHPTPESPVSDEIRTTNNDRGLDDAPPSKISLSTQDSINSEIYPSNITFIATMGVPLVTPDPLPIASTMKTVIIEEEDPSLFDHNPAFPPLPDDLSVLSNHGDEIVPEPSAESDHMPSHEVAVTSISPSTEAEIMEPLTTTSKPFSETTVITMKKAQEATEELGNGKLEIVSTDSPKTKESPMLNLRSAIPTELLSAPSFIPEEITRDHDEVAEGSTAIDESLPITTMISTETAKKIEETFSEQSHTRSEHEFFTPSPHGLDVSTLKATDTSELEPKTLQEKTTSSISKSNSATEVTSQTELSSLPIETSDQNPHEESENITKDSHDTSTADPLTTSDKSSPTGSEVITVSGASDEFGAIDNVETTEFILTSFGSSESATDAVELIKVSGDADKSAAIINKPEGNKNALTDLIKLVSDVASMSDDVSATEVPATDAHPVHIFATSISDSEELIPVNAGYKSKNSNYNQNSITEIPFKSKNPTTVNKQKVVEIEDEESDNITDSPPPNDKVEPTTRRPIIDNVSDYNMPDTKTEKKDIEIITQSYVPTINRRPTKVVLKNDETKEKLEDAPISVSSEVVTEGNMSSETINPVEADPVAAKSGETIDDQPNSTLSPAQ